MLDVFVMADLLEVKFFYLLKKTVIMLKTAYKDDTLRKTQVFEWFSYFKNGEMSIED